MADFKKTSLHKNPLKQLSIRSQAGDEVLLDKNPSGKDSRETTPLSNAICWGASPDV